MTGGRVAGGVVVDNDDGPTEAEQRDGRAETSCATADHGDVIRIRHVPASTRFGDGPAHDCTWIGVATQTVRVARGVSTRSSEIRSRTMATASRSSADRDSRCKKRPNHSLAYSRAADVTGATVVNSDLVTAKPAAFDDGSPVGVVVPPLCGRGGVAALLQLRTARVDQA